MHPSGLGKVRRVLCSPERSAHNLYEQYADVDFCKCFNNRRERGNRERSRGSRQNTSNKTVHTLGDSAGKRFTQASEGSEGVGTARDMAQPRAVWRTCASRAGTRLADTWKEERL